MRLLPITASLLPHVAMHRHYAATPITFRITAPAGYEEDTLSALTVEILEDRLRTSDPIAAVSLPTPTGPGPWDVDFPGAAMDLPLLGNPELEYWTRISVLPAGSASVIWHTARLTLIDSGSANTAAAPPDVTTLLTEATANELYPTLAAFAAQSATIPPAGMVCSARMTYIASPDNRIIPNNTVTAVKLNAPLLDPDGMYDATNGRINILKSGYYRITARMSIEPGSAAARMTALVHKTAGGIDKGHIAGPERSTHAGEYASLSDSEIHYLNYGDVLRLEIYQNSGANTVLKINEGAFQVGLSVEEIRPEYVLPVVPLSDRPLVMYGNSQVAGNICGSAYVAGEWLSSNFLNRGVAGITIATIATTKIAEIMADANPAANFILLDAINDFGYSASPDIAATVAHVATIVDATRTGYRSSTLVLPGAVNYGSYTGNASINTNTGLFAAAMVAANIPGLRLVRIDQNATLGLASDPLNPIWRNEGLHYTRKAQKLVADLIAPIIAP